jgi:molybdopterin synthase catalytic subunit
VAQRPAIGAHGYDAPVLPPDDRDDWLGVTESALPVGAAHDWAVRPECGAVVLFSGTVRDHADGRDGVEQLTYEAYEEQVVPRLEAIAAETRARWPSVGRLVLLHRIGTMSVGESSVIAVASAPHRPEAFTAARFAIDALKATAPIWKHETWADGADWGTGASPVREASEVESAIEHAGATAPLAAHARRGSADDRGD